jgi:hypothetical protein
MYLAIFFKNFTNFLNLVVLKFKKLIIYVSYKFNKVITLFIYFKNFLLNLFILWRPLFKRLSYFGNFKNSRSKFRSK